MYLQKYSHTVRWTACTVLVGSGEWQICQWVVVLITAPQTVSAYNLVGVTFVRFLAVRKPLHFRQVSLTNSSALCLVFLALFTFCWLQLFMTHRKFVILAVFLNWILGFLVSAALYLRKQPPGTCTCRNKGKIWLYMYTFTKYNSRFVSRFISEDFCGICRTELIYDVWQIFVFMLLNVLVPVAVMSAMYISAIRLIASKVLHLLTLSIFQSYLASGPDSDQIFPPDSVLSYRFLRISMCYRFLCVDIKSKLKISGLTFLILQ